MQGVLFNESASKNTAIKYPKIDKLIASTDNVNIELAFQLLKGYGLTTIKAINYILIEKMETDWEKLWDDYERNGCVLYVPEIKILGIRFSVFEWNPYYSTTLSIADNSNVFFNWVDGDKMDAKTMRKIKKSLTKYIADNARQIEFLIRTSNKDLM